MSEAERIQIEAQAAGLELQARLLREGLARIQAAPSPAPVATVTADDPDEKLTAKVAAGIIGCAGPKSVYEIPDAELPRAPTGGLNIVRFYRRDVLAYAARRRSGAVILDLGKARAK